MFIWVCMVCPIVLKAQHGDLKEVPTFRGAELLTNKTQENKLDVKLQVYYSSMHLKIPETENVVLYTNEKSAKAQTISLKKEIEILAVPSHRGKINQMEMQMGMKAVLYSAQIDLKRDHGDLDFLWQYDDFNSMISNIRKSAKDALSLLVHLNGSKSSFNFRTDFLGFFPHFTVVQNAISQDTWITPTPHIINYSTPYIVDQSLISKHKEESLINAGLKKAEFNEGFSEEQPLGKTFTYNRYNKELKIDSLPMGNYLLQFSIANGEDQFKKAQHQAFYLIQSQF